MIRIIRGVQNPVILTLQEKVTYPSPKFFVRFQNDLSLDDYYFMIIDTSIYKERYNEFVIYERSGGNPLNGEIELPLTGHYHYWIYEQNSSTDIDPLSKIARNLLETGKVKVVSSTEIYPFTKNATQGSEYKVHIPSY